MTAHEFKALCVPPTCTLREALAALNSTGRGILLVVSADGTLLRTLTDGDLRRAALAHADENSAVSTLPESKPIIVGTDASYADGMAVLDKHQIDHLPIVDSAGRAVDIMVRRELSQRIWL